MIKKIFFALFIFIFAFSCSSEDDNQGDLLSNSSEIFDSVINDDTAAVSFDRSAMLVFWANNIIMPAYKKLKDDISVLKESIASFDEEPLQANFEIVREKWLSAYKTWQHVEMFNVGKAEEIYLSSFMNIYPVNEDRITSNINSGVYDLENPNNYASQGFPALDYLLFGLGENDTEILEKYQLSNNYSKYLVSVIDKMEAKTNLVSNDWDSYRDAFVVSTENTATSSINKLTNDFIFYFEKGLRANKFGIPAGVFSTDELPDKVEGYHSKLYSKTLALESLSAVKNFFIGKAFENDDLVGDSFQSYMTFLNAKKNDTSLSDLILSKLDTAISSVTELNDDFASQINTDNNTMLLTYDRIQSVVILLKVDMLQVLNVNVDYADADGD